jgi:hypothetical protein
VRERRHVLVRKILSHEWQEYRNIRLAALSDAPEAFGSTLEAELNRNEEEWRARAGAAAVGRDRVLFVLEAESGDWQGMAGGHAPGEASADVDVISM